MIRRWFPILALVLLPVTGRAADAAPLSEPGPVVETAKLDEGWQKLFDTLAAQGAVLSRFTENRWFPFRKIPVVLKGEMRLVPGRGLCLRYTEPEERMMLVDDRGLLLRDARGRTREIAPDPDSGNVNAALLPVLRFDRAELGKVFQLHAARDGGAWRLDFVPREEALSRSLGRITVWGEDVVVKRLEFRRSSAQRVEILIDESQVGVTFGDEDLKRYFR